MKYGLAFAVLIAALIFLFVRGMLEEKKKKRAFGSMLSELYGKPPAETAKNGRCREPGPDAYAAACGNGSAAPDGYLRTIRDRFLIDEITWRELDMDAVFRRLDYTWSRAGTEYLYAVLHCPAEDVCQAEVWEETAAYFAAHPGERIRMQTILAEIGGGKGMSFHDCLAGIRRLKGHSALKEYAADAVYLLAVLLAAYHASAGLCLFVTAVVYQVLTYFQERAKILPYLNSVAELLRMAGSVERLYRGMEADVQNKIEQELQTDLADCCKKLGSLKRHSFWVLQCGREGSSPVSILGDYIRMLLHPDMIQFQSLKKRIAALEPELKAAYACIGYVDACISIVMYRASLKRYCIPQLYVQTDSQDGQREMGWSENARGGLCAENCYHPLLEHPVANSIAMHAGKGVLLTGSNASGKSTFLKTAAVNLLLAQTVHTALAERFSAPISRIYTAMQDGGDIRKGESSYMAEILSLKRILDAGKEPAAPVFCFVDEILRGTNTVERIAASTQILKKIRPPEMYCFAATHDRELAALLQQEYDNYYFTEEIRDGDILFSYRLLPGCADSCNAIRLLAAVGYEEDIVAGASEQAETYRKEGIWR